MSVLVGDACHPGVKIIYRWPSMPIAMHKPNTTHSEQATSR
jgi:hypothetical protein